MALMERLFVDTVGIRGLSAGFQSSVLCVPGPELASVLCPEGLEPSGHCLEPGAAAWASAQVPHVVPAPSRCLPGPRLQIPCRDPDRHVKVKQRGSVLNMLRRLDKIRFRGHKRDDFLDLAESPNASDTECGDEVPLKTPRTSPRDGEELRDPAGPGTLIMAAGVQDFNRTEFDRLNEIKGHLEIALLEKHFLQWLLPPRSRCCVCKDVTDDDVLQVLMTLSWAVVLFVESLPWPSPTRVSPRPVLGQPGAEEELRKLREETNSEMLRQELDRERQRRMELEQKVQEPPQRFAWGAALPTSRGLLDGGPQEQCGVSAAQASAGTEEPPAQQPARGQAQVNNGAERGARPVTSFVKNLSALSDWYSVYTSAIAFTVYMNAVWHGWAIPMFLFLAILRLSLNYLIARGWRIQWSIVPEVSEVVEPPKEDLTVSEKFQLVLDVAQKAQVLLRALAGCLRVSLSSGGTPAPQNSRPGSSTVSSAVSLSTGPSLTPKTTWALGSGCGLPGAVRPPGMAARPWGSVVTQPLPPQNLFGKMADVLEKIKNLFMWVQPEITQKLYIALWAAFLASCFFPYRLVGLAVVCENGWRCCLINRDRKMPTDYIRNGVLYVTENYLCFESSKSGSSKRNKVIKLVDITDIQKSAPVPDPVPQGRLPLLQCLLALSVLSGAGTGV
ncbi:hypothetical protein CB1_000279028 [Camelus ferus]|nr:hypothetical protein CB1_000279028 [Camelus ferus]